MNERPGEPTASSRLVELVKVEAATGRRIRRFHELVAFSKEVGLNLGNRDVENALKDIVAFNAVLDRESEGISRATGTLVFTAYSSDYSIGGLCSHVNRRWAERHGYEFACTVLPYANMMAEIAPRKFLGWYKALMLNRLLTQESQTELRARNIGYLMWIDADAFVIDHSKRVEDIVLDHSAGGHELIIAEDSSKCCLLNTGVLIVRVCDWSRELWSEVWEHRKYFDTYFYEQSALVKCLRRRGEGLEKIEAFHSFAGGPQVKTFPHCVVLPTHLLNSNVAPHEATARPCAQFIFHALGRNNKLRLLVSVAEYCGLDADGGLPIIREFQLIRGPAAGPPSQEKVSHVEAWLKKRDDKRDEEKEVASPSPSV